MAYRNRFYQAFRTFVFLTCIVVLSSGCGKRFGPTITVKWRNPKPGITEKMPVKYIPQATGGAQIIDIGEVRKCVPESGGTAFKVGLYKKYAHYVRTDTVFLFREAVQNRPVFIEAKIIKQDTPAAADGDVLNGLESDLELQVRSFVSDWKLIGIIVVGGLIALAVLVFIVKMIFKGWAIIVCLAGGGTSVFWLSPWFLATLLPLIPEGVPPQIVAHVVAFLAGYIACTILLAILRAPLKVGTPHTP